jgi:hypothetical protein
MSTVASTIDLTPILLAMLSGLFTIFGIIINKRMKDAKDSDTMRAAVLNSIGAAAQAARGIIVQVGPKIANPGIPENLMPNLQYALDHAGDEFARAGISPIAVASKIVAQQGLLSVDESLKGASRP